MSTNIEEKQVKLKHKVEDLGRFYLPTLSGIQEYVYIFKIWWQYGDSHGINYNINAINECNPRCTGDPYLIYTSKEDIYNAVCLHNEQKTPVYIRADLVDYFNECDRKYRQEKDELEIKEKLVSIERRLSKIEKPIDSTCKPKKNWFQKLTTKIWAELKMF